MEPSTEIQRTYTRVTFRPDFEKLDMKEITEDDVQKLRAYVMISG